MSTELTALQEDIMLEEGREMDNPGLDEIEEHEECTNGE